MQNTFGARVRRHRERQGIALSTIADKTKIKASLLEGLERDDLSHWPTGIFRRAWVRSYAHAIGLDADAVIREFLERYPEPVEEPEQPPTRENRLRALVGSAFGSLRHRPAPQQRAQSPPAPLEEAPQLDLLAAARLCTELGRARRRDQVIPLLHDAVRILNAKGLVVWVWDAVAKELRPALVDGYSDRVRKQMAGISRDAGNATAAAFRTAQTCVVNGGGDASGALAVPMMTAAACAGVLAIELPRGGERAPTVLAVATFLAAMLAQLVGGAVAGGRGRDEQGVVVRDGRDGAGRDSADPLLAPARAGSDRGRAAPDGQR